MFIMSLFAVSGKVNMIYEHLMEQSTQTEIIKQALSAEVANVVAVVALFLVVVIVIMVRMMNRRDNSESRIVTMLIGEDSPIVQAVHSVKAAIVDNKNAQLSVSENLRVLSSKSDEQIAELRKQNVLLTDFKNYQKLNNDQVTDVGNKVDSLDRRVGENTTSIISLESKVDDLASIQRDIDSKLASIVDQLQKRDCADIATEVRALQEEVRKLQPVNAVSTTLISFDASTANPPNVTQDDAPAGSEEKVA